MQNEVVFVIACTLKCNKLKVGIIIKNNTIKNHKLNAKKKIHTQHMIKIVIYISIHSELY